jgi:hypothetical protein
MSLELARRLSLPAAGALVAAGAVSAAVGAAPATAAGVSAPEVFAGFKDHQQVVGLRTAVSHLQLPVGTYALSAKVTATAEGSVSGDITCRLDATTDFDISRASLRATNRQQTPSLQVTKVANSPKLIVLSCRNSNAGQSTALSFIKITAIRVADPQHLHNGPLG